MFITKVIIKSEKVNKILVELANGDNICVTTNKIKKVRNYDPVTRAYSDDDEHIYYDKFYIMKFYVQNKDEPINIKYGDNFKQNKKIFIDDYHYKYKFEI